MYVSILCFVLRACFNCLERIKVVFFYFYSILFGVFSPKVFREHWYSENRVGKCNNETILWFNVHKYDQILIW